MRFSCFYGVSFLVGLYASGVFCSEQDTTFPFKIDWDYFKEPRGSDGSIFKISKSSYREPVGGLVFTYKEPPTLKKPKERFGLVKYQTEKERELLLSKFYQILTKTDEPSDAVVDFLSEYPELTNIPFLEDGSVPDHLTTKHYNGFVQYHGKHPVFIISEPNKFMKFLHFGGSDVDKTVEEQGNDIFLRGLIFLTGQKGVPFEFENAVVEMLLKQKPALLNKCYKNFGGRSISEIVLAAQFPHRCILRALSKSMYLSSLTCDTKRMIELLRASRGKWELCNWLVENLGWKKELKSFVPLTTMFSEAYSTLVDCQAVPYIKRSYLLRFERRLWALAVALGTPTSDPCAEEVIHLTPHELWLLIASITPEYFTTRYQFEKFHSWTLPGHGKLKRTLPVWLWELWKDKHQSVRRDCTIKFST